ncbi:hypothetical protein DPMN_060674 [Dreissena polymorpha]|uniref:Uncharacterized protein n=1 Tax=Dreissena polymorpha TaxID=45954 RepID=A0A9D4C5N1_DREPO|nr:hypothetical protein DPMN_060674 [Dreissena polymorpha]
MTTWSSSTDLTPPLRQSGNSAGQGHLWYSSRGRTLPVLSSPQTPALVRGVSILLTHSPYKVSSMWAVMRIAAATESFKALITFLIRTHQRSVQKTAATTSFSECSPGDIASVVIRFILQPNSQSQSVLLFVRATEARYVALIGG